MRNTCGLICLALAYSADAHAQRRALDWSFYGGDAQRTGWEKTDSSITKENVKDFQLVIKRKLDNGQSGPRSLTPPVVIGNLISYKGFKELGFVAGSSGAIWSIDVDTDRVFWRKQLGAKPLSSAGCPATVTAVPSLTPPLNFARGRTPRTGAAPAPAPASPPRTGILGTGGFGAPRPAFALSSDGNLHLLNTSNGDDLVPAIPFIPPRAIASSLAISDGVIYTTTDSRCGGAPAAVWALDLSAIDPKNTTGPAPAAKSFRTNGGNISALGGVAFGSDGAVYVQTGEGQLDPAANKWAHTLLALTPKELTVEKYFTSPASKGDAEVNLATPVVFPYKDRDLVVTAGSDGALSLLDAQSLGGQDRKTALYRTPPLTTGGRGIWGGLSSWQEQGGTRWVLASVWGPTAAAPHGAVVAFKVEDQSGQPVLTQAWVSRDMTSPEPPVIASGVVFALSAEPHATLYALDALTGKELYSTGNQVAAPANLTGLTVANGRVYFTTTDSTLYAFGIFMER